jgi:hypothetical protein
MYARITCGTSKLKCLEHYERLVVNRKPINRDETAAVNEPC